MYQYRFPKDPDYRSDPAEFVKASVYDLIKYDVVADPSLTNHLFEVDCRNKKIKVRRGEAYRRFNAVVDLAVHYAVGGREWAPEVHEVPKLRLITGGASEPEAYAQDEPCCPTCKRAVGEN